MAESLGAAGPSSAAGSSTTGAHEAKKPRIEGEGQKFTWVEVDGGTHPIVVETTGMVFVSQLLDKVKKTECLDVRLSHMTLRTSEGAVIQVDGSIPEDTTKTKPLFVEVPVGDKGSAIGKSVAPALRRQDLLVSLLPMVTPPILPETASALKTLDGSSTRSLLERDSALELMSKYIDAVLEKEGAAAEGSGTHSTENFKSTGAKGWKMCAALGASGMGKSSLLETLAGQQKAKGRETLFVTYNTEAFQVPNDFWNCSSEKEKKRNVAAALMWAAGAPAEKLRTLPSDATPVEALEAIKQRRHLDSNKAVVVCVDELLQLKHEDAVGLVSAFMRMQEASGGRFAVVFSAFSDKVAEGWLSNSGRQLLRVVLLPLMQSQSLAALVAEARAAARADPCKQWLLDWVESEFAKKVVQVLATHPRSLFCFLPECQDVSGEHQLGSLVSKVFGNVQKLHDLILPGEQRLLELLRGEAAAFPADDALLLNGFQLMKTAGPHGQLVDQPSLAPFFVRALAFAPRGSNASACNILLRRALDADLQVTSETRARAERVVQYFDALKREACGATALTLQQFFSGAQVGESIKDKQYTLHHPNGARPKEGIVQFVDKLTNNSEEVLKLLRCGHIVVPRNAVEESIEDLAPLFELNGKLVVLARQVKAGKNVPQLQESRAQVPHSDVCKTLLCRAKAAGEKAIGPGIKVIPVLMLNSEPPLASAKWHAVQLNRMGLQTWLQYLMPLQMVEADEGAKADAFADSPRVELDEGDGG